jgi:aldose 1-epimerase
MAIEREPFGEAVDGRAVELYTLTNGNGLRARIATYGATLVSLEVPDRHGACGDIVLGFDSFEPYLTEHPYFGSVIGRYANRIRGGKFTLNGNIHQLPCNDGTNHLHGGPLGFHRVIWNAQASGSTSDPQLTLTYHSSSGEQGYPGNVNVELSYTLTQRNELMLDYTATTDAPTIINLTHHAYFNLAGAGTILDHELQLFAYTFLPVDEALIPLGEMRRVEDTPFDFTTATAIGARINAPHEQLMIARGYDHNWVLKKSTADCALAGEIHEPVTGRSMTVHTTQPGVQIYSGNFLDGSLRGKNRVAYPKHAGFCFETQHFPDSPNRSSFPSTVLEPGATLRERTVYRFGAR